jgi:hypothetical protein
MIDIGVSRCHPMAYETLANILPSIEGNFSEALAEGCAPV